MPDGNLPSGPVPGRTSDDGPPPLPPPTGAVAQTAGPFAATASGQGSAPTHPPDDDVASIAAGTTTSSSSMLEADDSSIDAADEGYAHSTSTSYLTSIASSIRRGIVENGRTYAAYGIHKAWIPSDDAEMDRNDLQHCKFTLLMNNQLHLAPITENPQKILDLGTGSGIWAMDMADKHPSAEVIGVDTTPVQPSWVPDNCVFEIDDVEHDWLWPAASFDLIHGRELIMAIHDWPRLVAQAFTTLKPGGYLHLAGSVPEFTSDDGSLSRDSAYVEMGQIYFQMSERIGASGKEPLRWKEYLEAAGYEDVVERVLKIPTNPWPRDERLKKVGAFELSHFRDSIANVFARGYEQILGGDPVAFEVLLARARREVLDRNIHSWVPFYVVYGRRPDAPPRQSKSPDSQGA